jgi:hypothetical protein
MEFVCRLVKVEDTWPFSAMLGNGFQVGAGNKHNNRSIENAIAFHIQGDETIDLFTVSPMKYDVSPSRQHRSVI